MTQKLLILLAMVSFLSCKTTQNLPTVEKVDIEKYAGVWYEIARLPNSFEKGLECVTATYTVKSNGKIEVLNKGFSVEKKGDIKTAKGTARVPDSNYPGRLKVSFFWPFAGNYYIMSLDDNYQYALVGDPSRKFLWVLYRTKNLDDAIYSRLMEHAKNNGFEPERVIEIDQTCE
jgi:apolipoprotein D and lipocalin family protein